MRYPKIFIPRTSIILEDTVSGVNDYIQKQGLKSYVKASKVRIHPSFRHRRKSYIFAFFAILYLVFGLGDMVFYAGCSLVIASMLKISNFVKKKPLTELTSIRVIQNRFSSNIPEPPVHGNMYRKPLEWSTNSVSPEHLIVTSIHPIFFESSLSSNKNSALVPYGQNLTKLSLAMLEKHGRYKNNEVTNMNQIAKNSGVSLEQKNSELSIFEIYKKIVIRRNLNDKKIADAYTKHIKTIFVNNEGTASKNIPYNHKIIIIAPEKFDFNSLPWFCKVNSLERLQKYAFVAVKQNTLDLMHALSPNITIDTYFNWCLMASARELLRLKYDANQVLMAYYLLFPNACNINSIVFAAKHIKEFRAIRRISVYSILSKSNQKLGANEKYLLSCLLRDMTKIAETIIVIKIREYLSLPIYLRNPQDSLKNVVKNDLKNANPDCELMLTQRCAPARSLALDCKDVGLRNIQKGNIIRITHSDQELHELAQMCYLDLISKLRTAIETTKNSQHVLDMIDFINALEHNLNIYFATREVGVFLKALGQLYCKYIHVILNEKISANIPELIDIDDLDKDIVKEIVEAFLVRLQENFSVDSALFERVIKYSKNLNSPLTTVLNKFTLDLFS